MTTLFILMGVLAVVCVCLPCRWDPAILLKEMLDDASEH